MSDIDDYNDNDSDDNDSEDNDSESGEDNDFFDPTSITNVTFKQLDQYGPGIQTGVLDEEEKFNNSLNQLNIQYIHLDQSEYQDMLHKVNDDKKKLSRNPLGLLVGYYLNTNNTSKTKIVDEIKKLKDKKMGLEVTDMIRYFRYFEKI